MGIIFSEGSGLNDSVFGKSQEPIKLFIEKKAEAFEAESVVDKIFKKETSKNFAEKYSSMTSMDGFMPTAEGGAYPRDEMQQGYEKVIENVTWKNSFVITQEMMEDGKLIDMKRKPSAFITSYYRTREKFGAALLAGGISGTSMNFNGRNFSTACADNVALFSKTHPAKVKGGNQSNLFGSADFTATNLSKVESAMQDFRDDNAQVLAVSPDTIIIPNDAALKQAVFSVIGADKDPGTSNNGFNFQFGRWNVIVWQYLNQFLASGLKPWILMDSKYNDSNDAAVLQERVPLSVESYIDQNTDDNVWKGRARFSGGFTDWRAFACANISGGTAL